MPAQIIRFENRIKQIKKIEIDKGTASILNQIKLYEQLLTEELKNDNVAIGNAKETELKISTLKKEAVKKAHPNEISSIEIDKRGNGKKETYWQTNLNGKKIRKKNEDDLYEYLYDYYFGNKQNPTFRDIFKTWVEDKKEKGLIVGLTVSSYESLWNRFIEGCDFVDKPITDIKMIEITDYFETIVGKGITKKNLGNLRTLINCPFDYAYAHEIACILPRAVPLGKSLTKRCKLPEDHSEDYFTKEDRIKLLNYLESLTEQTVYSLGACLMMCLGARIGEYRALHWEDYDSANHIMHIQRSIVDRPMDGKNRVATEIEHTKSNSESGRRRVPVSPYAAQILEELREINGDKIYILNAGGNSTNPITTNHFNEKLKTWCKEAGIEARSSHKARFGIATALYEEGADVECIREILGHTTTEMTTHYIRKRMKSIKENELLMRVMGFPETAA